MINHAKELMSLKYVMLEYNWSHKVAPFISLKQPAHNSYINVIHFYILLKSINRFTIWKLSETENMSLFQRGKDTQVSGVCEIKFWLAKPVLELNDLLLLIWWK